MRSSAHSFTSSCLHLVLVSLALAASSAAGARAQEATCPDGLMRRGEAGTGMLLLRTEVPGCFLPAPSVASDINVDISGPIARTRITQRFENPANGWVEGVYLFPLPEAAAVDTLKMQVGDRFIEGLIKERQEARRLYEVAKAEGKRASLVEQERPNMFTNQVANIGPHETVVVQIEYQESLRFDHGRYDLRVPLVVAPRYSPGPTLSVLASAESGARIGVSNPVPDRARIAAPVVRPEWGSVNPVRLHVDLEAGFALGPVQSDSHTIQIARTSATAVSIDMDEVPSDRDFILHFAPAPGNAPQVSLLKERVGDSDYVLAMVVPPTMEARGVRVPRETIFVLDNSGSMAGPSMREAKAGLLLGLDRLTATDRFNIIRFDDTMELLFRAPVVANAENIARAKNFVGGIDANGGTEMLPALLAALADSTPTDGSRLRQVIFLTDGAVGNEAQLFAAINERLGRSRLFTVGIGSAPNSYFMAGAARAGRGTYTYINDPAFVVPRMEELFVKLENPVMTGLTATWPNGLAAETWPNPIPDLYSGEPVVLTLKAPRIDGALMLTGKFGDRAWGAVFDLSSAKAASGIEKLWARNKIAALDESRVYGVGGAEIDKEILELALAHHMASRLTSLVAVDVTPIRPIGAGLTSARVPLNFPAGWDFDKVFDERRPRGVRLQEAAVPSALLTQLAFGADPSPTVQPDASAADVQLGAGGTESTLMLMAGLAALLLAGVLMMKARTPAEVRP